MCVRAYVPTMKRNPGAAKSEPRTTLPVPPPSVSTDAAAALDFRFCFRCTYYIEQLTSNGLHGLLYMHVSMYTQ